MNKEISVFTHVVPIGPWKEIILSQLNKMKRSGLFYNANLYYFLNWDVGNYGDLSGYLSGYGNVKLFHLSCAQKRDYEVPSIRHLKEISDLCGEEHRVLYLHLKGVSRESTIKQIDWRCFMEWACIENWQKCLEILDGGADTVGVNLLELPAKHYSGNIWWATTRHIKRLPLLEYPHSVGFSPQIPLAAIVDPSNPQRFKDCAYDAEFWVCSIPSNNAEFASSHSKDYLGWHYANYYPQERYVDHQESLN